MSKNETKDHNKELIIITEPAVNGVVPEVQEGDIVFITKSRNYVHSDYMKSDEDNAKDLEESTDLSDDGLNKMVEKLTVSEPNEKIKTLKSWLNKTMKILMTDGRLLVGNFLCTDRDANVILGSCTEHINYEACGFSEEPRMLGLVMVPGRHIVSIHLDVTNSSTEKPKQPHSVTEEVMYFYRNGETDEKAAKEDDAVENN